jgi:hypothetical protein
MVNEESQPFIIIMKLWEVDFCLGNVPLQRLELCAKRGGKNGASRGNHFSLSFLNYFEPSDASLADMSLWIEWAGFLFFGLWIWLMAESHFFFIFFWLPWTIGLDGLWAFDKFLGSWTWSIVDLKNEPLQGSIWSACNI